MSLGREHALELYRSMLRIRRVQERIEAEYLQDAMHTPVHLCIGQEAVAVGVCAALGPEDYVSSNHRGHGHYLAKGGDLRALIAELHGRETGCAKGRGGSMHLVDTRVGLLGSSSIVGGGIPIGTGLALAARLRGQPRVSVVFFGDGAADEGVLYESVNFAMLRRLPVVYVFENNGYSVCSRVAARQAGDNVFHSLGARLPSAVVDGNDVLAVHDTARQAVTRARAGQGPSFLECRTYRILGHAGCAAQDAAGYRSAEEVRDWKARCPLARLERRLLEDAHVDAGVLAAMEEAIAGEIDHAFLFARESPFPAPQTLAHYLFSE